MNPSAFLCFVHFFIALELIGTNRITGLHRSHVNLLPSRDGRVANGQGNIRYNNRQAKTEGGPTIDSVKRWRIKQDNSHLQDKKDSNSKPCEGKSCLWSTRHPFKTKPKDSVVNHRRRRQSVFLAKALDMLDHARPGEGSNFATRATANRPFKPITGIDKNTNKFTVKNSTLVNKPTKNQAGDKRQGWSDPTSEMRPRFFFNSAPAEYVEQKPSSLRTGQGPGNLVLPPETRAGPHVPPHLHRINTFLKGVNDGLHMGKHPVRFPHIPANVVGNPLSHRMTAPSHFHNHLRHHQFGPPPYAIHINAPPRLEPPLPPPNLIPQNIPPFPQPPPEVLGEPMPPLNPPVGIEPPHPPKNDAAMPGDVNMLPPGGIPMPPPPINLPESTPLEDFSPVLPPRPPSGVDPLSPDFEIMPPAEIPIHTTHPIDAPIGIPSDLHMTPPQGVPMSPPEAALQGIPMPGEEPPMPLPHHVQRAPFPVAVPSPPRIENVPYPVPVPGPPSIQPLVVPVQVPSPPKIQRVPVPVESPPKIQNVPVPVPVAVPSPPQIRHVPYPVALPVKQPGEIQKIFYPIAVPQPSQIHHVPFPVYIRYPPEIRRIPFPVALPPKPFPVPVPSPPHYVIHRVPYPVMFPQKVPYPVPLVVQHHHIHEDVGNTRESVSNGQCLVNLCLNGGTCSAYMNTYRCHCPNGFQGKHCEEQNMCEPNPCKNFGTCSQVEHEYECTCTKGFIGKNCDRADPCFPSPCENGATCSSDGSSYSCTCRIGWIGKNCQVESKCLPINPCQNGGTCTEAQGRYQCDCSPGWSGLSLDTKEPEKINASSEMKRQRISDGFMFADRLNELPSDGVQLNENPDSFFANPLATKPEQRILHSSHFFSPAVHKFLPAEHRFSGEPIHRYLSSPVLFKDANTEGLSRFVARGDPGSNGLFEGPPMPPLFQGPPYHGNRVIIFNRPIHTPVPVPVHGPPRIAVIHHPVPLPPQQIPVPVPIPGPRPPQYIVIHRDFSGPAIDPCGVNPCRNGGTCTAVVTDFKCICPVGYKGERCEVQSRCLPNPCKNFGKCTELPEDFECTCHTGFHGKACDLESKCEPNPCRNGGVCTENIENYICSCAAGFMGKNCERESKCLPINPCKNSGVCTEDLSGYKCNCKDGFDGVNCEVRQTSTACDSTPCLNGGTCITDIYDFSKFSCYCGSGFTGLSCEELACNSCPGICIMGVCKASIESPEKGFQSLVLSNPLSTSPCVPFNPCLFGGKCLPDGRDYTCLCPSGRGGSHCEHFFHESSCNGCHHHAVCVSSQCTCRKGYLGDGHICRPKTSYCHPNPCENGGTCRENDTFDTSQSDWWCECPKGYSGRLCREYDPCSNKKCYNGGKCEVQDKQPKCNCEEPYQGESCLLDNSCLPKNGEKRDPCNNGGKCEFTDGKVTCVCPTRYEGPTCALDKCAKCDKNAYCENGVCKCRPPYEGDGITCTKPEEEKPNKAPTNPSELPNSCTPNKCKNGAECIEGKSTFYCVCPKDTYGRLCEKITPTTPPPRAACHPNPCLNGGMCKETGVNQDFECICPNPRFKGRFCDVDMCAECDPHARCINGKCFCRRGYSGDGFSCKRVKPKCPQYSYTVTGDICICNPGYYMNNTGKRTCIPITATSRTTMQHGTQLQIPPPALGSTETGGGQQWSEDIVVTEYRSLGCWADTTEWRDPSKRAMMVMEGLDPNLADNYHERKQPISKCADVAKRLGLKVFAIQNGGQCFGGADDNSYKRYGTSENCGDGVGGSLANDVYKL